MPRQTPFDSITAQLDLDGRWTVHIAKKGCGTALVTGRPGQSFEDVTRIASLGLRGAQAVAA